HASTSTAKPTYTYHATETLLPVGSGISLSRLRLLATQGDVPNAVRIQFGARDFNSDVKVDKGTGLAHISIGPTKVTITPDPVARAFRIIADDKSPARAVGVAAALGTRLTKTAEASALAQYNTEWKTLDDYREKLITAEQNLFSQLAAATLAN